VLCCGSTPSGPPGFGEASSPEDRAVIDVLHSERQGGKETVLKDSGLTDYDGYG
jgi:hypothetical protein